jgi:hypothetical protein
LISDIPYKGPFLLPSLPPQTPMRFPTLPPCPFNFIPMGYTRQSRSKPPTDRQSGAKPLSAFKSHLGRSPAAAAAAAAVSFMATLDSGCDVCILVNESKGLLQNPQLTTATVVVADGAVVQAVHVGLLQATLFDESGSEFSVNFEDALSVHGIKHALISVRALAANGVVTTFNAEGGTIQVVTG